MRFLWVICGILVYIVKLLKRSMSGNIVCYRFLRSLKTPWLGGGIFEGFWGILRVLARLRSIIPLVLVGSKLDCALPPRFYQINIKPAFISIHNFIHFNFMDRRFNILFCNITFFPSSQTSIYVGLSSPNVY